jgi:hypothetical protein
MSEADPDDIPDQTADKKKFLAAWEALDPADFDGLKHWLKFFGRLYSAEKRLRDRRFCASQQLALLCKFAAGLCGDDDQLKPLHELQRALLAVDQDYKPELFQPRPGVRPSDLRELPRRARLAAATEIYWSSKEDPTLKEAAKRAKRKAVANVEKEEILRWHRQFKNGDPESDYGARLYQFHVQQSLHAIARPGGLAKYADDLAESVRQLRPEYFVKTIK